MDIIFSFTSAFHVHTAGVVDEFHCDLRVNVNMSAGPNAQPLHVILIRWAHKPVERKINLDVHKVDSRAAFGAQVHLHFG